MRIEGVLVDLEIRGRTVQLMPDGPEFTAFVESWTPEAGQRMLADEMRAGSRISILRTADGLHVAEIVPGVSFRDVQNERLYRVTETHDDPASVMVRFICELSPT